MPYPYPPLSVPIYFYIAPALATPAVQAEAPHSHDSSPRSLNEVRAWVHAVRSAPRECIDAASAGAVEVGKGVHDVCDVVVDTEAQHDLSLLLKRHWYLYTQHGIRVVGGAIRLWVETWANGVGMVPAARGWASAC